MPYDTTQQLSDVKTRNLYEFLLVKKASVKTKKNNDDILLRRKLNNDWEKKNE